MRIEQLSISNFGPITSLDINFGAGTNGIYGANGKGKSHILAAVQWLVSGELSDKANGWYLHNYGRTVKNGKVSGRFSVDGKEIFIEKTLLCKKAGSPEDGEPPTVVVRCKLETSDGTTYEKVADAAAYMQSLMGVDSVRNLSYVFVKQNETVAPLLLTSGPRLCLFQRLAAITVCKSVYDFCTKRLADFPVMSYSDDITSAAEKLEEYRETYKRLNEELKELKEDKEFSDIERYKKVCKRYESSKVIKSTIDNLLNKIKSLTNKKETHQTQLYEYTERQNDINLELKDYTGDVLENVKLIISGYKYSKDLTQRREKLIKRKTDLTEEIETHKKQIEVKPSKPNKTDEDLRVLTDKLATVIAMRDADISSLEQLRDSKVCPTCRTELSDPDELLVRFKSNIENAQSDILRLRAEIKDTESVRRLWDEHRERCANLEMSIRSKQDMLASIGIDISEVDKKLKFISEEDYKDACEIVREYEVLSCDLVKVNANIDNIRNNILSIESDIADAYNEFGMLTAKLTDTPSDDEYKNANNVIERYEAYSVKLLECEANLKSYKVLGTEARKTLDSFNKKQESADKHNKVREFLTNLKAAFHSSAIPKSRMSAFIRNLNNIIAKYAEWLEAPFVLYIEPDNYEFMAQFNDISVPVFQLSGGQRMLAAWCFHLALYALNGRDVGFIMMDEPTTALDDANINAVADMVVNLNAYCKSEGLQFIMVTHEQSIATCFSTVIRL